MITYKQYSLTEPKKIILTYKHLMIINNTVFPAKLTNGSEIIAVIKGNTAYLFEDLLKSSIYRNTMDLQEKVSPFELVLFNNTANVVTDIEIYNYGT